MRTPGSADDVRLTDRRRARISGALASAVALALLWTLSGLSKTVSFPPTAIASAVVRETPGDVATFFIEALGHWAMRLITLGALAGAFLVGAEAFARTFRDRRPMPLVAGILVVAVAALAALIEPSAQARVLPTALALVAAASIYALAATGIYDQLSPRHAPDLGRRRVLRVGAGGAIGIALGGGVLGWFARRFGGGPDRNVNLVAPSEPAMVPDRGPFPDVSGLSPEVTSAADHYVVDINFLKPSVETEGWTLTVKGLIDNPLQLDFSTLQRRFEIVEDYSVLTCISNEVGGPLVGHSRWQGVRLRDVLEEARVRAGTVDVSFKAADGYTDSIPLAVAMDPAVIVAVAQNGEPLTQEHGFPCRVRIPAIYGMKNVKWLEEIEAVGHDYKGYWMQRGWSDRAIVKTQSRIDVTPEDPRAGEHYWIAGVAWAGDREVSRVEVSTDGGDSWEDAQLRDPIAEASWRLWAYRWTPRESGDHEIACRAVDGNGEVQSAATAPPHPAGASGYHTVDVDVS
jgi:DMSO/TMAO reductase YedYZ molybdopterin-dependent catalytic subunit